MNQYAMIRHQASKLWNIKVLWARYYSKSTSTHERMEVEILQKTLEDIRKQTDTILVTGGNGFLGQHIIRLLQETADYVKEIRVLDLDAYHDKLGNELPENIKVSSHVCDVRNFDSVLKACEGVDSVIHIAGLISFGTFPDNKTMMDINVNGTANVISGCIRSSVKRLIFCSTVDVVIGHKDIRGGMENTVPIPQKFLFPGYPESKYKAEQLILKANGRKLADGGKLQTLALRANVMYGELDPYTVPNGLRSAKLFGGQLVQVGCGKSLGQLAYVGNTAWAFLCADSALRENKAKGGVVLFIPDNTPVQNTFTFMLPYLECRGYTLSRFYVPFFWAYRFMIGLEFFLKCLYPLWKINLKTSACSIKYVNMDVYFCGKKAIRDIKYVPIFTTEEAQRRSIEYYKQLKL